ncbi:MAG: hypothetical protein JXB46_09330 [Candidatus Eisenbacteria bacterium]|nr:hypothetical protein [Candidatus Eisenbacteria bacterium]
MRGVERIVSYNYCVTADAGYRFASVSKLTADSVSDFPGVEESKTLLWDDQGEGSFSTERGSEVGLDFSGLTIALSRSIMTGAPTPMQRRTAMKPVALAVVVLLLAPVAAASQQVTSVSPPDKHGSVAGQQDPVAVQQDPVASEHAPESRIEGDTIEEALVIPTLPFCAAGSTCGFTNDYDEMCPWGGSNSPEVVYAYTPAADMCVSISLCDSYYDTKLYIYTDEWPPGSPYACNDDNFDCVDPPVDYTSWLPEIGLTAGQIYYIVVDGYGNQCGDYVLEIEEVECNEPCNVVCEGIDENEPTCHYGYVDVYNGGCSTESYLPVPVSQEPLIICGESGVFDSPEGVLRDADWYLINPCGGVPITVTVEAEFDVLLMFIDMRGGCENMEPYGYVQTNACEPAVLTEYLPLGQFAIFVAPDEWLLDYECGVEYSMTIEGYTEDCHPTPVEARSWGSMKALYR